MPPLPVALIVVALMAGSVLAAAPASARVATSPAAGARVLVAKIRALQVQADAALKRYDTAFIQVASGVGASLTAGASQRAAEATAAQTQEVLNERVRSLYVSGGRAGLYASLFNTGGVEGFTSRIVVMQRLVSDSSRSATDTATAAERARATAGSARTQAESHITTAGAIGGELARLEGLLNEQQRLLDSANAAVRRIAEVKAAAAALQAARDAAGQVASGGLRRVGPMPGSPEYFRLYHAAATTCAGLSWTVLAAIGQIESGHGRNMGPSSAGARGPMQFMPRTFAAYGVDGDRDGRIDIMGPADSIFSAARYLCANGAGEGPAGLRNAIFRYNHANWYVDMVLALAARYAAAA